MSAERDGQHVKVHVAALERSTVVLSRGESIDNSDSCMQSQMLAFRALQDVSSSMATSPLPERDAHKTIREALSRVVAGMRAHTLDLRVQAEGCGAISALARQRKFAVIAVRLGALKSVLLAMSTHPADARVQHCGCLVRGCIIISLTSVVLVQWWSHASCCSCASADVKSI